MIATESHPPIVKSLVWANESQTQAFAESLAHGIARMPPDTSLVLELHGDLGAGKTTFVRHLLHALGVTGRIKSPTYAVVEPYHLDSPVERDVWHFDFYRFNDPDEWEDAGFRDIFASPGLKLIEWPEKAGPHLPAPDLDLRIDSALDERRHVQIRASGVLGQALIA
ncbi:MAG: tRNA (adenosine(37)-N6)-threonylcarbamoyltransferase complex ATPase subunit type 1 TsaE [Pseudomonadota bacterium]